MHKHFCLTLFICLLMAVIVKAQPQKGFFRISSTSNMADKNYGVIDLEANGHTTIINTIMAYGENVKGLSIQINNGFPFKLAPSQSGSILNYVGSNLSIVLQPGDKARIEFVLNPKTNATRQLYVAGEVKE